MSALFLKLTALFCMLIDHTAAVLRRADILRYGTPLYTAMRAVGRIAFPIFCYQLAQGAVHTKNKKKYALRLLALAVLSELPFDRALFGKWIDPKHQNVFFTLLLGLLVIYVMQWGFSLKGRKKPAGIALSACTAAAAGCAAQYILHCDYRWAGVFMIAVMGLTAVDLSFLEDRFSGVIRKAREKLVFPLLLDQIARTAVCAAGITVCVLLTSRSEIYAFYALIPIFLYNRKKGYSSKAFQYGTYFFYPVHLLLLALLFL